MLAERFLNPASLSETQKKKTLWAFFGTFLFKGKLIGGAS
jgi:hypothetical protein